MGRTSEFDPPGAHPDPTAPGDGTTLTEVLASFTKDGFSAQFIPAPDATVECLTCRSVVPALRLEVIRTYRFEGASDPAEMMRLYGVRCPSCATMGTFILGYGVNADDLDADIATSLLVPSDTVDLVYPTL